MHHRVMEEPDALFNVGPSRLAPGKIFLGVGEWPEGATVQLDVAESQRLRKRLADAELQVLGSIFSDVGTTQLAAPSLTALPEWDEWAGLTKGEG